MNTRNLASSGDIHLYVTMEAQNGNGATSPRGRTRGKAKIGKPPAGNPSDGKSKHGKPKPGKTKPGKLTPGSLEPPPDAQPNPEPAAPSLALPDPAVFHAISAATASSRRIGHPDRTRLNLFILRHASAGVRRVNPKLDVKRPLDKEGKRHCLHLAHVLGALKLSFDLIVSSPLKRCLQTAQLVGTEMGYEARILHAQALEPGGDYAQFQRLVYECRSYENVLMVGHNPTLTNFLGQLIREAPADGADATAARVRLRKGSLARLTLERGPATLQWMLDPRIVRALYTTSTKSSRRKTSRK